jgi:nitrate/TMAO reductase-like tetraheme cytochrome c subunit
LTLLADQLLVRAIREDSRQCRDCHVNNTHDMCAAGLNRELVAIMRQAGAPTLADRSRARA